MVRKVYQNGDIFTAEDANAIAYPLVDGDDFIGHGPKVLDSSLDDTPGQIKSNFYTLYNRLKVTHQSGLTFAFVGGAVLLPDGSSVSISPGTINIPNTVTRYIYVGSDGTVQAASTLPNVSFPLAKVTTAGGTLSGSVIDLRDKVIDRVAPADIPAVSAFQPGMSMDYCGSTLPSGGWLWQDGTFYAPSAYPALFAAIGYTYGQSGTNFRVPDSRGRVTVGAGSGAGLTTRTLGQGGGLEGVTLNVAQTPSHTHGINDSGHSHSVNESPHLHTLSDPSHSHAVADPGHAHGVYDPGHSHGASDPGHSHPLYVWASDGGESNSDAFQYEASAIAGNKEGVKTYRTTNAVGTPLMQNAGTGISINGSVTNLGIYGSGTNLGVYGAVTNISMAGAKTNVSLNTTTSNISLNAQGGNGAHENMQPWLAVNKIIKY